MDFCYTRIQLRTYVKKIKTFFLKKRIESLKREKEQYACVQGSK